MLHKLARLCLLPKLFNKTYFMFHASAFGDVMTSECLKSWKMIISRTKRAFEVKFKKILVQKALYFSHKKQTSKNIEDTTFKACVRYFSFFFHQMTALKWLRKMLFISSKKLFWLSRYSTFCISVFPYFCPVSHWLRGWWEINLKVYDVSSCLSKNLITHIF